jgi:hypothetical protein
VIGCYRLRTSHPAALRKSHVGAFRKSVRAGQHGTLNRSFVTSKHSRPQFAHTGFVAFLLAGLRAVFVMRNHPVLRDGTI